MTSIPLSYCVIITCCFSYRQRLADCLGMVAMHVTVVVMVLLDLLLLTTLLLIDQDVICGMSHIRHHPNVRTSMYAQSAAVVICSLFVSAMRIS